MPPSLMIAANRVPLAAYQDGRPVPRPSTPSGQSWGGADVFDWARTVVEKVKVSVLSQEAAGRFAERGVAHAGLTAAVAAGGTGEVRRGRARGTGNR